MKLRVETTVKESDKQLLELITIDLLKTEQQHPSIQDIIILTMTTIINSYFNKHPIAREFIHRRLLHPYASFMKEMFCYQTLNGIPKHFPKKLNKATCTIYYTEK